MQLANALEVMAGQLEQQVRQSPSAPAAACVAIQ